ncbi:helix-turn-helix domain-containing protein [Arthrobacter sulfonylureivorans]|uniref:helix-turn-helix domain-containing protein n=1 Tax=Arthrobacter sulfonylureivorans TaxID=2486855 RepID=UPI0039E57304
MVKRSERLHAGPDNGQARLRKAILRSILAPRRQAHASLDDALITAKVCRKCLIWEPGPRSPASLVELRGIEPLTFSLRTVVNAGSLPSTKCRSDKAERRSCPPDGSGPFTRFNGQSVWQSVWPRETDARGASTGHRPYMTDNANITTPAQAKFMTRAEAADYIHRSPGTLANWAYRRRGPAFYRLEDGQTLYAVTDLDAWFKAQRVEPRAA